jgi:hypothetical protein
MDCTLQSPILLCRSPPEGHAGCPSRSLNSGVDAGQWQSSFDVLDFLMARLKGSVLASIALLLSVRIDAFAVESPTVNMIGHGVESCRAWMESRKDGHSAGYGDWLLGYLSGVNLWGPTAGRDLLLHRSGQEMMEWVDKYCRVFPNDEIESAARQLILDLGRRAKEANSSSK